MWRAISINRYTQIHILLLKRILNPDNSASLRLPGINAQGFWRSFHSSCFPALGKQALVWVYQTFEPMDSGPHTNLGFGGKCLFFRPLSRSQALGRRCSLSRLPPPSPDGAGLPRLRVRRASWQVETSIAHTFNISKCSILPSGSGIL